MPPPPGWDGAPGRASPAPVQKAGATACQFLSHDYGGRNDDDYVDDGAVVVMIRQVSDDDVTRLIMRIGIMRA